MQIVKGRPENGQLFGSLLERKHSNMQNLKESIWAYFWTKNCAKIIFLLTTVDWPLGALEFYALNEKSKSLIFFDFDKVIPLSRFDSYQNADQNEDFYEKPDLLPNLCRTIEINVVVSKTKFLVGKYSRTLFKKLYFSIWRSVDLNKSKHTFLLFS